jgi:fucose permease
VLSAGGSWRVPYLLITLTLLAVMIAVGRRVALPPSVAQAMDLRDVLRQPLVVRAWGSLVLLVVVEFSVATWAVTYVKEVGGASGGLAAAIGAVWGLCIFAGRLALPRYRLAAGPWATSLALLVSAAGIGMLWFGPGLWARVIGLAVTGLGCSVLYPLGVERLYDDGPHDPVALGAVAALGSGTAIVLGPPLVGVLADQVGLRSAILPLAGLALVGAWMWAPRSAAAVDLLPEAVEVTAAE